MTTTIYRSEPEGRRPQPATSLRQLEQMSASPNVGSDFMRIGPPMRSRIAIM